MQNFYEAIWQHFIGPDLLGLKTEPGRIRINLNSPGPRKSLLSTHPRVNWRISLTPDIYNYSNNFKSTTGKPTLLTTQLLGLQTTALSDDLVFSFFFIQHRFRPFSRTSAYPAISTVNQLILNVTINNGSLTCSYHKETVLIRITPFCTAAAQWRN